MKKGIIVSLLATFLFLVHEKSLHAGTETILPAVPTIPSISNSSSSTKPELVLVVQDTQVVRGASTTISWNSSHTHACAASGGWSGSKATAGIQVIVPAYIGGTSVTTRYTLTCVGSGEYLSKTVSVTASEFSNNAPDSGLVAPIYTPTTSGVPVIKGARETSTINTASTEVAPTLPTTVNLIFNRVLVRGMSGDDVYALQVYLADDKTLFNAVPNAYFGPVTEAAVKKFQLRYGVVASNNSFGYGVFGSKTQAKFLEVYNKNSQ